jgi:hypothetical protein
VADNRYIGNAGWGLGSGILDLGVRSIPPPINIWSDLVGFGRIKSDLVGLSRIEPVGGVQGFGDIVVIIA